MSENNTEITDIENVGNNLSLKGISKSTWVSTGLTVIGAANELCLVSGIDTPLSNVSNNTWSTVLTIGFLVAVRFYSWWHNNSVTKKAQVADKEVLKKK